MSHDADIVTLLIRCGAKPVGRLDILQQFSKNAPLDDVIHMILIGDSGAGKSTLAEALQMPITTSLGDLITGASAITHGLHSTVGTALVKFTSSDFGQVLLYDCAGDSKFHAYHGALLQYSNVSSAPLFLIVVNLNENVNDIKSPFYLSCTKKCHACN